MRAADVRAALTRKFCAPEWAIFYEVGEGTGARGGRYADAVAMNLWPSRGCELHGFEIKVSRSDWLHELKQPDKSDPVQRNCDRWWVVTPADIIKPGELPPTWGHYVVKGNGLNVATMAPQLERSEWKPPFLAALLRRAHEHAAASIRNGINEAMASERAAIEGEIRKRVEHALEVRREAEGSARKQLERIMEASGFGADSSRWFDADGFGRAAKFVHDTGVLASYGGVRRLADEAQRFADKVRSSLPIIEQDEAA
jgi:hypothetical protein